MKDTLYFHGKTQEGRAFTIAGEFNNEGLKLGIALCSKKDQLYKKLGRKIAKGRMEYNSKGQVTITGYYPIEKERIAVFREVIVKHFNAKKVRAIRILFQL